MPKQTLERRKYKLNTDNISPSQRPRCCSK
uniref:Uncharacterized protein n=1 Tax=Arundo donax TaxID=35708 RepID=A0A0A8ZAG8_ARUDO